MKITPVLAWLGIGASLLGCHQDVPIGDSVGCGMLEGDPSTCLAGSGGTSGTAGTSAAGSGSTTGGAGGATSGSAGNAAAGAGVAGNTSPEGGAAGSTAAGGNAGQGSTSAGGAGSSASGSAGNTTTGGAGGSTAGSTAAGSAGSTTAGSGGVAGSGSTAGSGGVAGTGSTAGAGGSVTTPSDCGIGWPTVGGTYRRASASCLTGPTATPTTKWTIEGTAAPVTIGADGTLYAIAGQKVNAWHSDGTVKWSTPLPADQQADSALTVAPDGTLYVQDIATIRAFDAAGQEAPYAYRRTEFIMALSPDGPTPSNPMFGGVMVGQDGLLTFPFAGVLVVVDPAVYQTGAFAAAIKRQTRMNSCGSLVEFFIQPSRGPDGSVYLGCLGPLNGQQNVSFLEAIGPDGKLKWEKTYGPTTNTGNTPASASSVMVGQDGTVYARGIGAGPQIDRLTAFHADGTERWSIAFSASDEVAGVAPDGTFYVASFYSPYPQDEDRKLRAHHPDGTLSWDFVLPRFGGLAIGGDGSLVVSGDVIYGLSPDGQQQWIHDTTFAHGPAKPGPVVLGPGNRIYARHTGTGALAAIGQ